MAQNWSFFMPPMEHGFIRRLDDHYRAWLTPRGRGLLWGLAAAGVMRMGTIAVPLYVALSCMLGLLVAAGLAGLAARPSLKITRRLPPPPSAGEVWGYDVLVENTSSRTIRDLHVQERGLPAALRPAGEHEVLRELKPGERARLRLQLRCLKRGDWRLSALHVSSSFPAGLVKVGRRISLSDRALVYPAFNRLEGFDVPAAPAHQPGGIPSASRVGESMEFAGLREWRDGDRPRDVHWPAYARTGRLVVREFQQERFVRLALVIDAEAPDYKDLAHFERALSLAAAIADALARRDYIIDIFAAGDQVHRFRAGRALANVENILELLACMERGSRLNTVALEAAILPEARSLSAVIFVATSWDPRRAATIGAMKAAGLQIRVLSARPGVELSGLAPDETIDVASLDLSLLEPA